MQKSGRFRELRSFVFAYSGSLFLLSACQFGTRPSSSQADSQSSIASPFKRDQISEAEYADLRKASARDPDLIRELKEHSPWFLVARKPHTNQDFRLHDNKLDYFIKVVGHTFTESESMLYSFRTEAACIAEKRKTEAEFAGILKQAQEVNPMLRLPYLNAWCIQFINP
jgi:hypothetical protein